MKFAIFQVLAIDERLEVSFCHLFLPFLPFLSFLLPPSHSTFLAFSSLPMSIGTWFTFYIVISWFLFRIKIFLQDICLFILFYLLFLNNYVYFLFLSLPTHFCYYNINPLCIFWKGPKRNLRLKFRGSFKT